MGAKLRSLVLMLVVTLAGLMAPAAAQSPPGEGTVRVATRVVPPLVIEGSGKLSGFSIELWNSIAERLALKSEFVAYPDVKSLLDAVRAGHADTAIAAISITAEREREFEFSLPMLDAGLQILVRSDGVGTDNPLSGLLRVLLSKTLLLWLSIAAVLVIVPAHLLWLIERGHKDGILPDKRYFPGIFHAMWWATSTLAARPIRCRGTGWRACWRSCGCSSPSCSSPTTRRSSRPR